MQTKTSSPALRFFFGHHKGATTWVRYMIERLCRLRGDRWAVFDNPKQFDHQLAQTIQSQGLNFVAYTNADAQYLTNLPPFRGFHVVRDPRDTLVSAYFSHRNSHPTEGWPELQAHRDRLQNLSIEDGLLAEMDFSANVFAEMTNWDYNQPHILELKFERLIEHPYATMLEAFSFLGMIKDKRATAWDHFILFLNTATQRLEGRAKGRFRAWGKLDEVPAEVLLAEVHQRRFSKLTGGRQRGEEGRDSHYRKGQPGDWRNHFTPRVAETFVTRYGALLDALEYTR